MWHALRATLSPLLSRVRAPLDAAIDVETRRLELLIARVSQFLYAGAFLAGLALGAITQRPFGLWLSIVSVAYFVWYSFLARALTKGQASDVLRIGGEVISATVPWIFCAGLALSEGSAYALSSWVPPMLFCALMMGGIVRMRPLLPLVFGAAGAIVFPALYFLLLRERLPAAELGAVVYQPSMQLARGAVMALSGGAGALVTLGLRALVGRAERTVRQQDLFGKYRLVRRVAFGGMGTVWEALYCPEGGFSRRVAVKQIHEHLAGQTSFVDAFRAEAELSAQLAHPNLVQVMDFGRSEGTYFLAMEFVDGMTLSGLAAQAAHEGVALSRDLVVFIGLELCAGLMHAHEGARGEDGRPLRVVHRDLCPQNILLSRNGEVKIADFGVARALGDAKATSTRTLAGHMGYVAPEQARGQPVDARTDLFAVGIVLWELLAGRHLFLHDNDVTTLMAVVSGDIAPPSAFRPELEPTWDELLAKALARDPWARFASAREMAVALRGLGASTERAGEALAELVERYRALPEVKGRLAEADATLVRPTLIEPNP